MALTKGLLLKGLAGLTVCGGAATGGTLVATGVIGGGGGNGSGLPPAPNENQSEDGVNANGSTDTDPNLAAVQRGSEGNDSGLPSSTDGNQSERTGNTETQQNQEDTNSGGVGTKQVPLDGSDTPGSKDEATIKEKSTEETSKVEGAADSETAKTTNPSGTDPNSNPAQEPSGGDAGDRTTNSNTLQTPTNQDGTVQQSDNQVNTNPVTKTDGSNSEKGQESNGKSPEVSENPTNPGSGNTSQGGSTDDQNNTHQGSQISGQPSSSPTTTEGGQSVNQVQDSEHTGNNGGSPNPVPGSVPGTTEGQGDKTDDSSGTPGSKPAGDSSDLAPQGTSGTPRADGASESTLSKGQGTGRDSTTGGSGSSDSSTTDTVTQTPSQPQTKEAKINAKLEKLGLPKDKCNFAKDETTKTCSISEKELKKIKFEDSDDDEEDSSSETASGSEEKDIQLKIEILTGNKKTDYGLNDGDGDDSDVTKDLLFTVSGFDNEINVGHDSTTLYPNTNPEFKIEGDELKKLWGTHSDLTKKVGINKKDNSNSYEFDNTQSLKYSLDSGANIKTLNSPTSTGTISVEPDKENYNLGMKVTFSANVTSSSSEGSDSLESGDYEIKYKDGDNGGWYLSKAKQTTGGGES